jgi:hypothetical protein
VADTSQTESPATANRGLVLSVVGAIATGIGVIGFVTVVGGAIMWIRFDKAGIPADKAVAVIPRSELVVVGLYTLIPFIALGLLAVFVAYLIAPNTLVPTGPKPDPWGDSQGTPSPSPPPPDDTTPPATPSGQKQLSPLAREALGAVEAARSAASDAEAAAEFGSPKLARDHADRAARAALRAEECATLASGSLKDAEIGHEAVIAKAHAAKDQADKAAQRAHVHVNRLRRRVIGSALGLLLLEFTVVGFALPAWYLVIGLVAVAIVFAVATFAVGWRTPGFALFGATIFASVVLFGTVRAITRTLDEPKVQSVAVLRSGSDSGLMGYYIAETSDTVYLGRVEGQRLLAHQADKVTKLSGRNLARIVAVPRDSVVAMEIGPLRSRSVALSDSKDLLQELCAEKISEAVAAGSSSGGQSKKSSSKSQSQQSTVSNPCPPMIPSSSTTTGSSRKTKSKG